MEQQALRGKSMDLSINNAFTGKVPQFKDIIEKMNQSKKEPVDGTIKSKPKANKRYLSPTQSDM